MGPNFRPWDQILNFLALTPNAGPTQTHAGCRWTPFDLLVHVDHVFLEGTFVVFRSILQRCESQHPTFIHLSHNVHLNCFSKFRNFHIQCIILCVYSRLFIFPFQVKSTTFSQGVLSNLIQNNITLCPKHQQEMEQQINPQLIYY